jgi:hypothetical protein
MADVLLQFLEAIAVGLAIFVGILLYLAHSPKKPVHESEPCSSIPPGADGLADLGGVTIGRADPGGVNPSYFLLAINFTGPSRPDSTSGESAW